jgi:hypothetical protein
MKSVGHKFGPWTVGQLGWYPLVQDTVMEASLTQGACNAQYAVLFS